jgi:hypothetical protein
MATLTVDGPDLVVRLNWLEKIGAVHGNLRVPVRAVRSATLDPDPWGNVGGVKVAGTGIYRVAAYGTRYRRDGREFTAVLGRRPAIRVELGGESPFSQLVVSVADAENTVAAINAAAGI